MADAVLDASALLALLNTEPGVEMVSAFLPGAVISAVNLSEVVAKLSDSGMPEAAIAEVIGTLGIETISFDQDQAYGSVMLRASTRRSGLSLGDRACLNLARSLALPALTADKTWSSLPSGVEIKAIR